MSIDAFNSIRIMCNTQLVAAIVVAMIRTNGFETKSHRMTSRQHQCVKEKAYIYRHFESQFTKSQSTGSGWYDYLSNASRPDAFSKCHPIWMAIERQLPTHVEHKRLLTYRNRNEYQMDWQCQGLWMTCLWCLHCAPTGASTVYLHRPARPSTIDF